MPGVRTAGSAEPAPGSSGRGAPERAPGAAGPERSPGGAEQPPGTAPAIALSPEFSVSSLGFALDPGVAADGGRALRASLVASGLTDPRVAERLQYLVVQLQPGAARGYLEMDAGRLGGSLALHWSGWSRLSWGIWQDPTTGIRLDIRDRSGWYLSWGVAAHWDLPDAGVLARVAGASTPALVWAEEPRLAGLPPQLQPVALAVGDVGGERAAGVARLVDEQTARVALVAGRLALARVLAERDDGLRLDDLRRDGLFLIGSLDGLSVVDLISGGGQQ